ncbi:MAG: exodeoxyribonuclease VII large subunit [Ruminococcaceae bacterium]|nr:exodeoxyribonuclease VII large subunit [Oscillospiraceae bacterium]
MQSPLILTVTQLNTYAKSVVEQDVTLSNVFVMGEISNFVDHYRSGHLYMSIKDNQSVISAVMFSGNASRLKFKPENGMSVIIRGRVSIYERDGRYQLYIDDMQPDGIGALAIAFEQMKEKLSKAGLFDVEHKMRIPEIPEKIGVISSPTGAAVQDVLNVLNRRFPVAEIVFAGVQVQGDNASPTIIDAIKKLNKTDVDVIIIARGGGSAEDLWPFNDEKLAYAIYDSQIPIISGVGHETDFTICDFVADLRAPTPSVAAELAVPDIREQKYYISALKNALDSAIENNIKEKQYNLEQLTKSTVLKNPEKIIENCELYLDSLITKINMNFKDIFTKNSSDFAMLCSKLESLSPLKVLARGYSITKKDNNVIINSKDLSIGDSISIQFADGNAKAKITEV